MKSNLNKQNSQYQPQAFLLSLAEFLERTICGTGFGRSSLVIEVVKNNATTKKYAIIHEGVPSQRYVLTQEQMQNLIEFLKSGGNQNSTN
ncbi:hypothetical protein [Fischerella sp. PCC 9605]|uniref:hypothetical protein n=1 Tax=Fischerella sp. PCC 9605 TaxID=1173024 RepID=UPI00047D5059|nr:hypothetical protein [Fischerella sp. PCC 9605]